MFPTVFDCFDSPAKSVSDVVAACANIAACANTLACYVFGKCALLCFQPSNDSQISRTITDQ